MAIQNQLLQGENGGLRDALTYKKKGETRRKPLDLLQHYEYWEPNMLWTPSGSCLGACIQTGATSTQQKPVYSISVARTAPCSLGLALGVGVLY
jgi:hypothetical protein